MHHHLFVYGTLMSRQGRNSVLQGAELLGPATVSGRLYSVSGAFPALLRLVRTEGVVHGELYRIAPEALRSVLFATDRIESYSERDERNSMYLRRHVPVLTLNGEPQEGLHAQTYVWNYGHAGLEFIPSGDWRQYVHEHGGWVTA